MLLVANEVGRPFRLLPAGKKTRVKYPAKQRELLAQTNLRNQNHSKQNQKDSRTKPMISGYFQQEKKTRMKYPAKAGCTDSQTKLKTSQGLRNCPMGQRKVFFKERF